MPVAAGSTLPDIVFYLCGGLIGAAGGALQAASRTMMVRQANPDADDRGLRALRAVGQGTRSWRRG
jgi:MFS transporter, UMF1 family